MNIGLTSKQRDCLAAIGRLTEDGVSPSYEELRLDLGLASRSGVHRLLQGLEMRGHIRLHKDRHRSIELVDPLAGKTNGELKTLRKRIDRILMERGA